MYTALDCLLGDRECQSALGCSCEECSLDLNAESVAPLTALLPPLSAFAHRLTVKARQGW